MTTLRIEERASPDGASNAVVIFDHSPSHSFPVQMRDPFAGTTQERELEWYYEHQIDMPIYSARAAAALIPSYGETLFNQLIAARRVIE